MPQITFTEANGQSMTIDTPCDVSLMQAAVNNLVPGIAADCGGGCSCATCHVYLAAQETIPPPEEMELELLSALANSTPESRLSCQIIVTDDIDGLVVRLPESQY